MVSPSQRAEGAVPRVPLEQGPERRLRLCPGCWYRAVPAPPGWVAAVGVGDFLGSRRGGVWAGSSVCALLGARRGARIPFPRSVLSRGSSGGARGQRGHLVLSEHTDPTPLSSRGSWGSARLEGVPLGMVLKVTAKGGVGDFGTGVLALLSANPGLDVGEDPLSWRPQTSLILLSPPHLHSLSELLGPLPPESSSSPRQGEHEAGGQQPPPPLHFPVLALESRATPVSGPGWAGREGGHRCLLSGECPAGPGLSPAPRSHKWGLGVARGRRSLGSAPPPPRPAEPGAVPGSQMMMMVMMMRAGLTSQDAARRQSSCHFSTRYQTPPPPPGRLGFGVLPPNLGSGWDTLLFWGFGGSSAP